MEQEPTKEQKEFMEKTMAHRKEKVEELAYKMLAISLKADIPVFDLPYYVMQRSKEMIGEAFKGVSFKNKQLIKARKKFLRECLVAMRENLKVAEKKEEIDETAIRDNRCEPVAHELAKMLLDDELIFSDDEFFNQVLENEEGVPLDSAIGGYGGTLDDKLVMIISEHWRRSMEKLWGKEKESVKFSDMDEILKRV